MRRQRFRLVAQLREAGEVVHVEDVAGILDCGLDVVYKAIRAEALPAIRVGGQYRIRTVDAARYLEALGLDVPEVGSTRIVE